jgi:hypothetical protein
VGDHEFRTRLDSDRLRRYSAAPEDRNLTRLLNLLSNALKLTPGGDQVIGSEKVKVEPLPTSLFQ